MADARWIGESEGNGCEWEEQPQYTGQWGELGQGGGGLGDVTLPFGNVLYCMDNETSGEEAWAVDYRVLWGDPGQQDVWKQLDDILMNSSYECEGGGQLKINSSAIDSGGHHTQAVYKFVRPRFRRRVYGVKGASVPGRPVWPPK